MPTLFDPITLGEISLRNRIVMAGPGACQAFNPGG